MLLLVWHGVRERIWDKREREGGRGVALYGMKLPLTHQSTFEERQRNFGLAHQLVLGEGEVARGPAVVGLGIVWIELERQARVGNCQPVRLLGGGGGAAVPHTGSGREGGEV